MGVSSIGLQCSVGEHELHVDDGIGDAHEGGVTKSLARHTWRARAYIALATKLQNTVPIMEASGM